MKKFFIVFLVLLYPHISFADVYISSLLPNTGNGNEGEYIEIRNTGCVEADLDGYSIFDKSGKRFLLSGFLGSKDVLHLPYGDTRIQLNDTDETLDLQDLSGTIVDSIAYAKSVRGEVMNFPHQEEDCDTGVEDDGGIGDEGNTDDDSEDVEYIDEGDDGIGQEVASDENMGQEGSFGDNSHDDEGEEVSDEDEALPVSNEMDDEDTEEEITVNDSGTETGSSISDDGIGEFVWSGSLEEEMLEYYDEDSDGFIDTLILVYPEMLTGSVNTGSIFLYSNTGGLSEGRIATQTGYILSGSILDNAIILSLSGVTLLRDLLSIDNTPKSMLRLKTSGDIGVRTLYGQPLKALLLTSSFANYTHILHPGGEENVADLMVPSSETELLPQIAVFPQVFPELQRSTKADFLQNSFVCTVSPCAINLDFTKIFSSDFPEKDYTCTIRAGGYTVSSCNPPQWSFTTPTNIDVTLIHKQSGQSYTVSYPVIFDLRAPNTEKPSENDLGKPVIIMELDGDYTSDKYELDGENHLICFTETCSVNFTAAKSFDPEGSSLKFAWFYDGENLKNSRNPGAVKFGTGEHIVELVVTDVAGNTQSQQFFVSVLGKKEKPSSNSGDILSNGKKIQAILPFVPPEIVIQNPRYITTNRSGNYTCSSSAKTCSVNFLLSGALSGYEYHWMIDGEEDITINPRSHAFSLGNHSVMVQARNQAGEIIWQRNIAVSVVQIKKEKTPSTKQTTKKTTSGKDESPENQERVSMEMSTEDASPSIPLVLSSLFFGSSILWRVRKPEPSEERDMGEAENS